MLNYQKCAQLVASARDGRSKPYANNTRIESRGEGIYALRLHATDIATFYEDGRVTLNAGGWRTVTTKDRLSNVTSHLYSERGQWFVRCEPSSDDPEPIRGERSIPKPFHALDPGPEPEKSSEGCIAGTEVRREWDEEALVSKDEVGSLTGITEADIIRPYERESKYFIGYRMRHRIETTHYREERYGWHLDLPMSAINEDHKGEQCPHCALFDRQHDAWETAMNGGYVGNAKRILGYRKMAEMLERFGSREAWQEAYLQDFREAREARTRHQAWVDRNRVSFEDGMEITAEGYAKRPDLKAIAREQRKQKRIAKKKDRINKFVEDAIGALEQGMPMPSGGDCWGCAFRAEEDKSIEPMGVDHLEEHINESYYVPSMFVNALRESGYRDAGIYMFLGMRPEEDRMGGERISKDNIRRGLRKYLYRRLLPEVADHAVGYSPKSW